MDRRVLRCKKEFKSLAISQAIKPIKKNYYENLSND